jgi:hypothetical protein
LAVSNYGNGSHICFLLAEELGGINYDLQLAGCARQRARSTRFHNQKTLWNFFPWQILALELIPSGSRPSN